MTEIIAGVEIPETVAVAAVTRLIKETASPLLFHHSRRVFLFGSIHARASGLEPDPELLYAAAMFHDTGLLPPFSASGQRFEIDGADYARAFLLDRGFSSQAAEVVWEAVALHTTPGIPQRMGPEVAATNLGVLTDAIGLRLDELDSEVICEVTAAHPRGHFKTEFLQAFQEGLRFRPDTTYGTVNADILERFMPDFHRTSMVDRIIASPWSA